MAPSKRQRRTQALDDLLGVPAEGTLLGGDPDSDTGLAWLSPEDVKPLLDLEQVVAFGPGDFVPASGRRFPGRAPVHSRIVTGDVAGDVAVAGILAIDNLVAVHNLSDLSDLTSEFTITADGTINNTGGTSTATKQLQVTWQSGSWDGYDQVGFMFPNAETTHGAVMLEAPSSWPSVNIGIIGISNNFGSGNVRLYRSGDTGTAVDLAVAVAYAGIAWSNVAFNAPFTGVPIGQTLQCPITRLGAHANDTLTGGFCVLRVYLTPGD